MLSSIPFALLGYATLAAHLHNAIFSTLPPDRDRRAGCIAWSATCSRKPPRPTRRPAGGCAIASACAPDSTLRGQHLLMLVFDLFLVLLLAVGIPAAWSVDTDAIVDGAGQLMRGVKVGGVTISLGNVGMAIVAFAVCLVIARLVRTHRARPRAADRRRAAAAAPIDRRRPQLCRRPHRRC